MGDSGGSSQPTSQTVTQNTIDPAMVPYYTSIAQRAQALSNQPYVTYQGQRTAQFDPMQQQAFRQISALKQPEMFGQAQQAFQQAGKFTPDTFDKADADKYMSPYQQAVTDIAVRNAQEEAARQMAMSSASRGLGASQSSANAIMNAAIGRYTARDIGDLVAKQRQESYLNAQQQFERDRAAREFAANLGLQSGQGLAALGTARQAADLQRLQALRGAGAEKQALRQQALDAAYRDFLQQRDWQRELLAWESGITKGLPTQTASSALAYQQNPGLAQQIAGLGGAALSAYGAFR
jgi:hypothetical protein